MVRPTTPPSRILGRVSCGERAGRGGPQRELAEHVTERADGEPAEGDREGHLGNRLRLDQSVARGEDDEGDRPLTDLHLRQPPRHGESRQLFSSGRGAVLHHPFEAVQRASCPPDGADEQRNRQVHGNEDEVEEAELVVQHHRARDHIRHEDRDHRGADQVGAEQRRRQERLDPDAPDSWRLGRRSEQAGSERRGGGSARVHSRSRVDRFDPLGWAECVLSLLVAVSTTSVV